MAISLEEIEYMKKIVLIETSENLGLSEVTRGGEYWYFPVHLSTNQHASSHSEILDDIEKRIFQSNRQSKLKELCWARVDYQSDLSKGKGIAIGGFSRSQATKFAYKLKLKSILLITPEKKFVVHSGYTGLSR